MSSPIHKFLFSPPPSPPHPSESKLASRPPPLTSLKSLISDSLIPRNSLEGLQPRSPRTPQQTHFFTLDNPNPYPRTPNTNTSTNINNKIKSYRDSLDIEATPRLCEITTPRRKIDKTKIIASPPYLPTNVPSTPIPIPSTLDHYFA